MKFFYVGFNQFLIGGLFFFSTILVIFQIPYLFVFFYELIFGSYDIEISVYYFIRLVEYFYVVGLCFYFSGIVLILISDYLRAEKVENLKFEI